MLFSNYVLALAGIRQNMQIIPSTENSLALNEDITSIIKDHSQ